MALEYAHLLFVFAKATRWTIGSEVVELPKGQLTGIEGAWAQISDATRSEVAGGDFEAFKRMWSPQEFTREDWRGRARYADTPSGGERARGGGTYPCAHA